MRTTRRRLIQAFTGTVILGALATGRARAVRQTGPSPSPRATRQSAFNSVGNSILSARRLVTYYGNPWSSQMGILGELSKNDLVSALNRRAAQYAEAGKKPVQPAIHMVVTTAQASAGADGLYRARMPASVIQDYANLAAANGMLFIADVQVGRSTVQDEVSAIRGILEQPQVHLALDPEFDMWGSQIPGQQLGHMTAEEINWALGTMGDIASQTGQRKILIVHQFATTMLPDKEAIGSDPRVDLAVVMDGWGGQSIKITHYDMFVRESAIPYGGIKLFFEWDPNMLTPQQALSLKPSPDVVIYQ